MTYGPNFAGQMQRAACYGASILKGAKPAGRPVEQPMTFDFVVNLKTAQALGLSIPLCMCCSRPPTHGSLRRHQAAEGRRARLRSLCVLPADAVGHRGRVQAPAPEPSVNLFTAGT